jgi:leucyl-tRNA synthetase
VNGKRPQAGIAPVARQNRKPAATSNEPPNSIFNDKLRRFKFRLEHTDFVTLDEVMRFMHSYSKHRYSKRGNPEITGAYADFDNNLLVVIGPPEAEQAIRKTLATTIIDVQGMPVDDGGVNLKAKKRGLQSKGREMIREMAQIEARNVELAAKKVKNREKDKIMKQLDSRFKALEAELAVLTQQIHVVDKYMKRLDQQPFRADTTAN